MARISLAKDFHRLLKRIGPLTEGQAIIDSVDWDNDTLTSFDVTIRPNDGFYKLGRFKFTVYIPDGYYDGEVPRVRCNTQLLHPNIDPWENKGSNVCLNLFDTGVWSQSYGLEAIVLGLLFLMHNPNMDDTFVRPSNFPVVDENFDLEQCVKQYMATGKVDICEYEMDFRVVDGTFIELKNDKSEQNPANDSSSENNVRDSKLTCPVIADANDDNEIDDDMDEDIRPVRFTKQDGDYYGPWFYTNFGDSQDVSEQLADNNSISIESSSERQELVQGDIHSGNVENDNEHQAMESDDVACDTRSSLQSYNSYQEVLNNANTGQGMDCSANTSLQTLNLPLQNNIVLPLQRSLTSIGASESQIPTTRSVSMPNHFNSGNSQTFSQPLIRN